MRQHLSRNGLRQILGVGVVLLLALFALNGRPQANQSVSSQENQQAFISKIAPRAQELSKAYGIKASLLIGQAALASDYGNHLLAAKYKNLYGVTAERSSHTVTLLGSVYRDNRWTTQEQDYVVYSSWEEGMDAYLAALKAGQWGDTLYTNLATHPSNDEAAQFIAASSYTTDPDYTNKLTAIISQYNLTQYD